MKKLMNKLEAIWVSVAFAEAGEHEISQHILAEEIRIAEDVEPCLGV
jgi:hypothetical protein